MSDFVASLPALLAVVTLAALLAGFVFTFVRELRAERYSPICLVVFVVVLGLLVRTRVDYPRAQSDAA